MTTATNWAERALHHAHSIITHIGPRGATTPEEKQAADYAQRHMQQIGLLDVQLEAFSTSPLGWLPTAIIFSIAVWSVFICWSMFYLTQNRLVGALVASGLCLAALALLYLEMTLRDHPLRRLGAHRTSYNAMGRIAPANPIKHRVVLVSSLDSPPAAAVLKTPRRIRLFRAVFYAGAASLLGSVVLYLLGGLDVWEWAFVFAGVFALLQSGVIIQSLRADHGEFTAGANNNASGLGTVLALAERLHAAPLQNTEVWIACCGSHTAGGSGLRAMLRQHANEFHTAWLIGFEGVGVGQRLIFISREGWLRRSVPAAVRDLIERTVAAHPDQPIAPRATSRTTVVGAAVWRGYSSVCLSVDDGRSDMPGAYDRADTIQRLQLPALGAAHDFSWRLLQQIDRG